MKRRLPRLDLWLACIYFMWSCLVYFGTLHGQGHSWWPLYLYYIIWPISSAYEWAHGLLVNWWMPNPHTVEPSIWMLDDLASGLFYIVFGTGWVFLIGRILSIFVTRAYPVKSSDGEASA